MYLNLIKSCMLKINPKTYFQRHENEIYRFINNEPNWIHIVNKKNSYKNYTRLSENLVEIDIELDTIEQLQVLKDDKLDLIIITDVFEVTNDIYGLLTYLEGLLNNKGKIIVCSINPKWNFFLKIFEFLKIKQSSRARSYIHHKKVYSIAESSGFDLTTAFTRQIFPFKLFSFGDFINNLLEILFFKFNLGINNYLILRKKNNNCEKESKTIIVPAKNEEKNLEPLISRIPKFDTDYEIIIVCGKSSDRTLEEAERISEEFKDIDIKVINQQSKGKGPGVIEAINLSSYDLITILDSDISVDPETLLDFFRIIENGEADFVNGTRFVYKMEEGAMRKLNSFGNLFFQFFISIVIKKKLTDSLCGTKVFKRKTIKSLYGWSDSLKIKDPFGDFNFIFSAAYSGEKILEYPVHYKARVYGDTQISRFSDGLRLFFYFINSFLIFNSSRNER